MVSRRETMAGGCKMVEREWEKQASISRMGNSQEGKARHREYCQ